MLVNNNVQEWSEAIAELILQPEFRQELVDRAYQDFCNQLSTPVAAAKLSEILKQVTKK